MPSSSASAHACSGPAPPKATSASSRGSWPRSTETRRSARSISAFTTSTTSAGSIPLEGALRGGAVELEPAGQPRRQPSEQQVRVGHRRARPASPVAGRPGVGAGALGPDPQRSARVAPDDRAAAGADGVQVDHRQPHRQPTDLALRAAARFAGPDQADVGRGPAHVQRDRVLDAREPASRADDAGRRARDERDGRMRGRLVQRRHAAGGAHHQRLGQSRAGRRAAERLEVAREHRRRDRRRPRSSRRARTRAARARPRARRPRARRAAAAAAPPPPRARAKDRGTRRAGRPRPPRRRRRAPAASRARAAEHARRAPCARARRTALERNERLRMGRAEPVEVRAVLAPQVEQVLEAGGRDERGPRAPALEQRVGGDRRAVREALDLGRTDRRGRGEHGLFLPRAVGTFAVAALRRRAARRR